MIVVPNRFRTELLLAILIVPAAFSFAQSAGPQGITEPYRDANVSASSSGTITAIDAREGQFVRAGDVIVELDSQLEALEVERRKTVADSMVEINAARTRMETLKADFEGTKKLHESTKSVSLDDLYKKELEYRLAQADLDQLLVTKEREKVEYRMADAQLHRRSVAAPFDGVIVQILLDVGESCNQQQTILRIVDVRKCRLVVHMEQAQSLKLTPGKPVTVRVREADGAVTVAGTVEFLSPLVDASSGLREVKVLFDNPDGRVHPGVMGFIVTDR
jgi:membrane fusion protein, multidrug efflux system